VSAARSGSAADAGHVWWNDECRGGVIRYSRHVQNIEEREGMRWLVWRGSVGAEACVQVWSKDVKHLLLEERVAVNHVSGIGPTLYVCESSV
jgi:streptomycin 6-kinase